MQASSGGRGRGGGTSYLPTLNSTFVQERAEVECAVIGGQVLCEPLGKDTKRHTLLMIKTLFFFFFLPKWLWL